MKANRILTKIVSLLVALAMLIPSFAFAAEKKDQPWDATYNHEGKDMPFTPAEGWVIKTVYVDGKTWTARSADGSVIPAGERVSIESMEGVKLFVTVKKEVSV